MKLPSQHKKALIFLWYTKHRSVLCCIFQDRKPVISQPSHLPGSSDDSKGNFLQDSEQLKEMILQLFPSLANNTGGNKLGGAPAPTPSPVLQGHPAGAVIVKTGVTPNTLNSQHTVPSNAQHLIETNGKYSLCIFYVTIVYILYIYCISTVYIMYIYCIYAVFSK